jgi:hypothetical protein
LIDEPNNDIAHMSNIDIEMIAPILPTSLTVGARTGDGTWAYGLGLFGLVFWLLWMIFYPNFQEPLMPMFS